MEKHKHTALLVMDMQVAIAGAYKDKMPVLFENMAKAIAAARKHHIQVIYSVVGFRPGYPELNMANKLFSTLRSSGRVFDTKESQQIDAAFAPHENDVIVTKKRISAFAGSDLEVILRSKGIQHLVLTGLATSGVVLSTLRQASDMDYQATVLADCCGDADEEVHRVLTEKIFPRQAEVMSHSQWTSQLEH
jgi:nicotinamidase-related amidase